MALHDPTPEIRKAPRFSCNLPASVRERGRPRSPARVIDISTHGCRLEAVETLTASNWVWLSLPGLETQYVRVVWSFDGFAGLEFAVPLNLAVLHRLVSGDEPPSERRVARLQELAGRCRLLSERASDRENSDWLISLSKDCEARAVVESLRTRFS